MFASSNTAANTVTSATNTNKKTQRPADLRREQFRLEFEAAARNINSKCYSKRSELMLSNSYSQS